MAHPIRGSCLAIACTAVLLPDATHAQEAASFEALRQVLTVGQTVIVTGTDGRRTRGKVDLLTSSSLVLRADLDNVGHGRSFTPVAVSRIQRTDRVWNGVAIGAAIGLTVLLASEHQACGNDDPECSANVTAALSIPLVGGGATIGGLIDRFIGNEILYTSSNSSPRAGMTLSLRF